MTWRDPTKTNRTNKREEENKGTLKNSEGKGRKMWMSKGHYHPRNNLKP